MTASEERFLFTSESVTEGHPDKIADQISDAVLDKVMEQDPKGRVACETLVTTGLVVIAGEITTQCYVDFDDVARKVIRQVGYNRAKYGFDAETCGIMCLSLIHISILSSLRARRRSERDCVRFLRR